MQNPHYLDLHQAREELAAFGIIINDRQMKRAAEPDASGKRKLPFFRDPIDGRLKINKNSLLSAYFTLQAEAEKNLRSRE
jgi:hypothetical protein